MKPDIICAWPISFDYPLFREQVVKNRQHFNKVIIVFTHNSKVRDYRDFLKAAHPDWTFCDTEHLQQKPNWYTNAIHEGLKASKSEWVLFLEQDFIYNDTFMPKFLHDVAYYSFGGLQDGQRLHFGCMAIKRALLDKTYGFFESIDMVGRRFDCFDFVMCELQLMTKMWTNLENLGFKREVDFDHLSGLTQNYHLLDINKPELITGRKALKKYNEQALAVSTQTSSTWMTQMLKMREVLKND